MTPDKSHPNQALCSGQTQHCERQRRVFDVPLSTQRYEWIRQYLERQPNIKSLTDLGCGNGRIICWLKTISHLTLINSLDSDLAMLEYELDSYIRPPLCELLFGRDVSPEPLRNRLFHGDLTCPDERLRADCFTMVELIEHLPLKKVEQESNIVFGFYQPQCVLVTTPNSEFNHLLRQDSSDASKFRHFDHKFEWTRAEMVDWASKVCQAYPYEVSFDGVGSLPGSEPFGPCTQIAIFKRKPNYIPDITKINLEYFDSLICKLNLSDASGDLSPDPRVNKITLMVEYEVPGGKPKDSNKEHSFIDWSQPTK